MRVEFAACIALGNVQEGQVTHAGDLDVVWRLDKVCTCDGAVGDETRAVTRLDTPGHLDALSVANDRSRAWLWGREQTEVVYGIDWRGKCESVAEQIKTRGTRTEGVLTRRCLVGPRPAPVRARLSLLAGVGRVRRQVRRAVRLGVGHEGQGECDDAEGEHPLEANKVRGWRGQRTPAVLDNFIYGYRTEPHMQGGRLLTETEHADSSLSGQARPPIAHGLVSISSLVRVVLGLCHHPLSVLAFRQTVRGQETVRPSYHLQAR